jgi:hypothetical protein
MGVPYIHAPVEQADISSLEEAFIYQARRATYIVLPGPAVWIPDWRIDDQYETDLIELGWRAAIWLREQSLVLEGPDVGFSTPRGAGCAPQASVEQAI